MSADAICKRLNYQPGEILEYTPNEQLELGRLAYPEARRKVPTHFLPMTACMWSKRSSHKGGFGRLSITLHAPVRVYAYIASRVFVYDKVVNTPSLRLPAYLKIAAALLCSAFLLLSARAQPLNPLVGTDYTATIKFNTSLESTLISVQSGIVTSGLNEVVGYVPQANYGSFTIDLNPDPYARIYTTQYALVTEFVGGWITVHIEFPSLSALGFADLSHISHDSRYGYSGLGVGTPVNSLDFVYAGNFYSQYGFRYQDWWGFSTVPNSSTPPDQTGNVAVPEPSTYGMIGSLALMGYAARRKRKQMLAIPKKA